MTNFIYGVEAAGRIIAVLVEGILARELFMGFALGFLVSTIVHAYLLSGKSRHTFAILAPRTREHRFRAAHDHHVASGRTSSYEEFMHQAMQVRFAFGIALFFAIIVVLVSLIRFW